MGKRYVVVGCVAVALLCSGCVSMSRTERDRYRELKRYDLPVSDHAVKSPALAAVMNVLPGMGNIYLAMNTDESSMWSAAGIGVVSWLVWPLSAVIAIPEGAIDAVQINKKAAVWHYTLTPEGVAEFKEKRAAVERLRRELDENDATVIEP